MAFEKNWRERRIVHRTPGGKLTRVKIGSLPAKEQQKYNPNRFKRDSDMTPNDFKSLQKRDVDAGYIFDFYIQVENVSDLDEIKEGDLILATSDSYKVKELFDDDQKILKLKTVPMEAVKKVIVEPESGDPINYDDIESLEFEDISDLEGEEKYEKIKFNSEQIYQLDLYNYLKYIDIVVDSVDDDDSELDESYYTSKGFYKYYYIGEYK